MDKLLKLSIFLLICSFCLKSGNGLLSCHPKCKCDHNKNLVVCDKAGLDEQSIHDLTDWLPKNVREIRLTGNHIHELPKNMFGNCSHNTAKQYQNLKKLDLSGNEIKKIHGMTFHCIPNLEHLSLANNNWVLHDHTGIFTTLPKLKSLDLTNCFRDKYNNSMHVTKLSWVFYDNDLTELKFLLLGGNEFQVFTKTAADSLCNFPNLTFLDMSSNNLSNPVFADCMKNLKMLNLSHNFIENVPADQIKVFDTIQENSPHPKGLTIDFRHNEWDCDCQLKDFVKWIKSNNTKVRIFMKEKLSCHNGQHGSKKLVDLDQSQMQCLHSRSSATSSSNAGVVVLSILLVLIVCIAVVLMVVKRERVKYYWRRVTKPVKDAYLNRHSQFGYSSVSTINT